MPGPEASGPVAEPFLPAGWLTVWWLGGVRAGRRRRRCAPPQGAVRPHIRLLVDDAVGVPVPGLARPGRFRDRKRRRGHGTLTRNRGRRLVSDASGGDDRVVHRVLRLDGPSGAHRPCERVVVRPGGTAVGQRCGSGAVAASPLVILGVVPEACPGLLRVSVRCDLVDDGPAGRVAIRGCDRSQVAQCPGPLRGSAGHCVRMVRNYLVSGASLGSLA